MVNNIHEVVPKTWGKGEVYKVKFKDLQLRQVNGKSRILEQQRSTDKFLNVNFHSSNIGKRIEANESPAVPRYPSIVTR